MLILFQDTFKQAVVAAMLYRHIVNQLDYVGDDSCQSRTVVSYILNIEDLLQIILPSECLTEWC